MVYLSKEATTLCDLINRTGSISVIQAKYLVQTGFGRTEEMARATIEILKSKNCIKSINDNYLVAYINGQMRKSDILTKWVMINEVIDIPLTIAEQKGEDYSEDLVNSDISSFAAVNGQPDMFFFISNGQLFDVTYMDQNTLYKASYIKKNTPKPEHDQGYDTTELFVFDESVNQNKVLNELSSLELPMPYDVYFVDASSGLDKLPVLKFVPISGIRSIK